MIVSVTSKFLYPLIKQVLHNIHSPKIFLKAGTKMPLFQLIEKYKSILSKSNVFVLDLNTIESPNQLDLQQLSYLFQENTGLNLVVVDLENRTTIREELLAQCSVPYFIAENRDYLSLTQDMKEFFNKITDENKAKDESKARKERGTRLKSVNAEEINSEKVNTETSYYNTEKNWGTLITFLGKGVFYVIGMLLLSIGATVLVNASLREILWEAISKFF